MRVSQFVARTDEGLSESTVARLFRESCEARVHAYAPYSNFLVGVACLTRDGNVYTGANFENASLGLSVCAEIAALTAANTAGDIDKVTTIFLVGGSADGELLPRVTPCGRCRQLIFETGELSGCDIAVLTGNDPMQGVEMFRISELLPHAFSKSDFT